MVILGIDPGLSGGLAFLDTRYGVLLEPMPTVGEQSRSLDLKEINRLMCDHRLDIQMAYMERVHSMPGQGVVSVFKFGRVFGALEALLVSNGIPYWLVTPQVWMNEMHDRDKTIDTKARSLRAFGKLFPEVSALATARSKVPHMGLVEAALIAKYGAQLQEACQ